MVNVYLDVGANNGSWGIGQARKEKDCLVYAFEPTPFLIDIIKEKSKDLDNYFLVPMAVSDASGIKKFNISGNGDWGCSSLLEFKKKEEVGKNWPGRNDIGKTDEVEVECVRLDEFCSREKIERINFLHCDAQGADLQVLNSLGENVGKILLAGEVEVASKSEVSIYADQTSTLENLQRWMVKYGFTITDISPNDPWKNELNVRFVKV